MRRDVLLVTILAASVLIVSARAQTAPPEEPYWTPDIATIQKLEASLKISGNYPESATYELAQYNRFYSGVTIQGRREVRGVLLVPPNREDHPAVGVHITDAQYLPRLEGGGCAYVRVRYWVDTGTSSAQCAFPDANAPPSEQPHWQPDESTASRMEAALRDYLHRAYPTLPDLSRYSRYYRGVTVNGRQVIRGRILMFSSADRSAARAPGMHLERDAADEPIFFDGGCDNISAAYDTGAARITALSCDGQGGLKPQASLP